MWFVWAAVAALSWGVWGYLSHLASSRGSAIGLLAGVVLIEALVLSPALPKVRAAMSWNLAGAALFGVVAYLSFYLALRAQGPPGATVAVTAAYPAVTLLISLMRHDERVHLGTAVGVALTIGGIALIGLSNRGVA